MKRAEFTINNTGLQFERDYGIDHRTGWTALHDGCVRVQFVSLWCGEKAGCVLVREAGGGRNVSIHWCGHEFISTPSGFLMPLAKQTGDDAVAMGSLDAYDMRPATVLRRDLLRSVNFNEYSTDAIGNPWSK